MCECDTHHWLTRVLRPRAGDQVITGTTTTRATAAGHALAAALELYDRRILVNPGTGLWVEVVLGNDVAAWVSGGPHGATRAGRGEYLLSLAMLHGTLLGHDWVTELPPLPTHATRVDLDLDPDPHPDGPMPDLDAAPGGSPARP